MRVKPLIERQIDNLCGGIQVARQNPHDHRC